MPESPNSRDVNSLDDAHKRIAELEKALDQAISVILKRDDQLLAHERQISELKGRLSTETDG